jgi:hypothetical protein
MCWIRLCGARREAWGSEGICAVYWGDISVMGRPRIAIRGLLGERAFEFRCAPALGIRRADDIAPDPSLKIPPRYPSPPLPAAHLAESSLDFQFPAKTDAKLIERGLAHRNK